MKTPSAWMPDAADESTVLELIRKMLDLGIPTRRADGGFRIAVDPDDTTGASMPNVKLIPAAV